MRRWCGRPARPSPTWSSRRRRRSAPAADHRGYRPASAGSRSPAGPCGPPGYSGPDTGDAANRHRAANRRAAPHGILCSSHGPRGRRDRRRPAPSGRSGARRAGPRSAAAPGANPWSSAPGAAPSRPGQSAAAGCPGSASPCAGPTPLPARNGQRALPSRKMASYGCRPHSRSCAAEQGAAGPQSSQRIR